MPATATYRSSSSAALSALGAKECFPGIAHVLVQLEHDREQLQRKVVKAADRIEADGVLRKIRLRAEEFLDRPSLIPHCLHAPEACQPLREHVQGQLDDMLQYEDSLADAEDRQRHHAMRIAVKRLRYTIEVSRPMCAGRLDAAVETVKRVQTLLGEVHDCDVWLDHLDAFAAEQRDRIVAMFGHAGRFLRLQPGIEYLRNDRYSHRQATFDELVRLWAELKERRFWEELARAADPTAAGPSTPAAAEPQSQPSSSA